MPEIRIQTAEFLLKSECDLGILGNRIDLESIADNTRIKENILELRICHFRDLLDIPVMKESPIILTLSEYSDPGESCLSSLEREAFEEFLIFMDNYSPFFIMISHREWIRSTPRATNRIHTRL